MSSRNERTGYMSSNDFGVVDIFGVNVLGLLKDMSWTCPWPQNAPSILPGDGTGHFQLRKECVMVLQLFTYLFCNISL